MYPSPTSASYVRGVNNKVPMLGVEWKFITLATNHSGVAIGNLMLLSTDLTQRSFLSVFRSGRSSKPADLCLWINSILLSRHVVLWL